MMADRLGDGQRRESRFAENMLVSYLNLHL